jgi:hypothetical protein
MDNTILLIVILVFLILFGVAAFTAEGAGGRYPEKGPTNIGGRNPGPAIDF